MKKVVFALVLGMIIGSATTALAAVGDKVEAVFAEFNLVVNGETKQLQDVPLVYNGTSYIPVRNLASLVGYGVTYNNDSRTIELTSAAVPAPSATPTAEATATPILNPPTKGEMNMSEWISLRELAEKNGAKVGFSPNLSISKDQLLVEFDFTTQTLAGKSSDAPHYEVSRDGKVNFMVYQDTSYIKTADAKTAGLLPQ